MARTSNPKVQQVADLLKKQGINSRMVSVSSPNWGKVIATIRDASISPAKVLNAIKTVENIHRCEVSGDILAGGNTFVEVRYADSVKDTWATYYLDKVKEAFSDLGKMVELEEGSGFMCFVLQDTMYPHLAHFYLHRKDNEGRTRDRYHLQFGMMEVNNERLQKDYSFRAYVEMMKAMSL